MLITKYSTHQMFSKIYTSLRYKMHSLPCDYTIQYTPNVFYNLHQSMIQNAYSLLCD